MGKAAYEACGADSDITRGTVVQFCVLVRSTKTSVPLGRILDEYYSNCNTVELFLQEIWCISIYFDGVDFP
jgi:hypothetical protein